jgi:hypothetical protein
VGGTRGPGGAGLVWAHPGAGAGHRVLAPASRRLDASHLHPFNLIPKLFSTKWS